MDIVKEKIIFKSLKLFSDVGLKLVTMDLLSKELGMSKRTLYEHFSSKEELIKQTFKERLNASIDELKNKIKNYQNVIHQKFLIIDNVKNLFFLKENKISFELKKYYPEIYEEISNIQRRFIKTEIRNNLTLGMENGLYRLRLNKKLTSEYFYLIEQIIMDENRSVDVKIQDEAVKNYFLELLIRSIATKKGLKELEKITAISQD